MRNSHKAGEKLNNRGFTLVEMAVTLTVISIVLAITFVGLRAWMRNSEFKKCNEYAHTLYTSASLELSALELSAELDNFTEQVRSTGTLLQTEDQLGSGAPADIYSDGRIYALSASAGDYENYNTGGSVSAQAALLFELIEPYSYDTSVCNETITIEYDTITQSVYGVFLSTHASDFVYMDTHGGDYGAYQENGTVSLNAAADYALDRSDTVRKDLMIGYYCVEELGVAASFGEGQLRVMECYLDNDETLDLVVASNSRHEESDVVYTATIYETKASGDQPLFDVTFSLMDLYSAGYQASDVQTPHVMKLSVNRYSSGVKNTDAEQMYFPVYMESGELHLTLDALMSAQSAAAIAQGGSAAGALSTSFTRFMQGATNIPDLCASVHVRQLSEEELPAGYDAARASVRRWIEEEEYIVGSSVTSNTENALFASVKSGQTSIATVRHLANIRYFDANQTQTFSLTQDLQFADAVIYDQDTSKTGAENAAELMELHTTKAFPSIPKLCKNWTLSGEKILSIHNYVISGLVLTEESIVTNSTQADTCYGMIEENDGLIKYVTLEGAEATLGYEKTASGEENTYTLQAQNTALKVRAAGLLCGLNQGTITDADMDDASMAHLAVNYTPVGSASGVTAGECYGIGLLCGVHDGTAALTDIDTAGVLEGYFYGINASETAASVSTDAVEKRYRYAGIGGVCGFTVGETNGSGLQTAVGKAQSAATVVADFLQITDHISVKNTAEVTGNAFVGGITGNSYIREDISTDMNPLLDNCSNEGLIHLQGEKKDLVDLDGANADVLETAADGVNADNCFAGGIIGYLTRGKIHDCTSAPGASDKKFEEQATDAATTGTTTKAHAYLEKLLTGNYVGGIAGCVITGELQNCETKEGGYVLGNDQVGGIVGYLATLESEKSRLTRTDSGELENNCYVIGHSNVGGIVGKNCAGNALKDCVNEGIVVGSGKNIGGIAGENSGTAADKRAVIENCTSEVFDYDNSIYTLVADVWQFYGDNVGGLVGYSTYGSVTRTDNSKTNISSIVVGDCNVGGVFGLAGADTAFDFSHYTMDGGEVYALGDCVGGYIGRNESASALPEDFAEVKPYFVQGRDAVGGAIGANLIDTASAASTAVSLSNTNTFGTVYGRRAVGGVIGYQRGAAAISGKNAAEVTAGSFGGGILGFADGSAAVTIKDCTNDGDLSDWQYAGVNGDVLLDGSVALTDLYEGAYGWDEALLDTSAYSYKDLKQALAEDTADEPLGSFIGGIVGFSPEKTTIENCSQTGMIYAQNGFGGIAGINLGTLKNCDVATNLGTQDSCLVGGLVSINAATANVENCTVGAETTDYTIEGKSIVGGLYAINADAAVSDSDSQKMYAYISSSLDGYGVGGLCGVLTGTQALDQTLATDRTIEIDGGTSVGGIVGVMCGTLQTTAKQLTDEKLEVSGVDAVGGVFGILQGGSVVDEDGTKHAYKNAACVTASNGCAGGIAGRLVSGSIQKATNQRVAKVTAYGETGYAGGIVAYVEKDGLVESCKNLADISSMNSCAGGICAWNQGTLRGNTYTCTTDTQTISSFADSMGVITAVNDGSIESCSVERENEESTILLQGSGFRIGGIAGTNTGSVSDCTVSVTYELETSSDKNLSIGGAIGVCDWAADAQKNASVSNVSVSGFEMELQGNCAYFGGLAGMTSGSGIVSESQVNDLTLCETDASVKGSCYGGLIGKNETTVQNCTVKNITAKISGLYQANMTLNADKQEKLAACFGGLIGKNETDGSIAACTLDTSDGYESNQIVVENGLVGGIAGINKGMLTTSGYQTGEADSAVTIAKGVQNAIDAYETKHKTDTGVDLETEKEREGYEYLINTNAAVKAMIKKCRESGIENLDQMLSSSDYDDQIVVTWMEKNTSPTLLLQLTGNGSIGGVAAYNTTQGSLQYCVSGPWLIDNRSSSQYSAEGGVIGTNESKQDTCFLINQAMVLRESPSGVTERVNGGVIGYQHNTSSNDWRIYGCINTGMVVNVNSHYSGGIIGRWSDQGGSIEYCRNYGIMQTSYQANYKGAAGGIVAQLYHPVDDQSYTILSCRNDGSILGVGSDCRDYSKSANDSGGIMGNVVTYEASTKAEAQKLQVNLIDCVNGPDVTIVAGSMCSGIITFLTSDRADKSEPSLANLELNIDRCRNYATDFESTYGFVGIFSDRVSGHEKTRITNCFTVAIDEKIQKKANKGYICYDGDSGTGSSLYDGGKSAICYNNYVLLVDENKRVDSSVQMNLSGATVTSYAIGSVSGTCYPVKDSSSQYIDGLENLLTGSGSYTVSGSRVGAQLYIQLDQPMQLSDLSLGFDSTAEHSLRVEYLTDALDTSGLLTGSSFTLAKEIICEKNSTETIQFPDNVKIYALRIQYVQNGVDKNSDEFQKYGYYYSKGRTTFTLNGLTLTAKDGQAIALSAGTTMTSPRLVDSKNESKDNLRSASTQYLFVANKDGKTYLVEPQFAEQQTSEQRGSGGRPGGGPTGSLSSSENARKAYAEKGTYSIVGSEITKTITTTYRGPYDWQGSETTSATTRPYGSIYAATNRNITAGTALNFDVLDELLVDHYKSVLAAAMPADDGSLRPETPNSVSVNVNTSDAKLEIKWSNSIDGAKNVVKYYLVTVTDENGNAYVSQRKCIGNSLTIPVTKAMVGKKLKASVCAVNENGKSGICTETAEKEIEQPMITPEVRLELIRSGGTYHYQISLENQEEYESTYGANWQVTIYQQGEDEDQTKHSLGVLNAKNTSIVVDGGSIRKIGNDDNSYSPSRAIWQLYAVAGAKDGTMLPSEEYSVSVYTPDDTSLTGEAIPGIQTLTATFDENYQSELDAKINVTVISDSSKTGIYPVYQVDLIRVDSDGREHILASKELAVSDQDSKVTFSDLPGAFFDAEKTQYFYVRAWVSQTGVGPVYTWHETDTLETNGSLLVNTTEAEKSYVSGVLLQHSDDFTGRIAETAHTKDSSVSISGTDSDAIPAWTDQYAIKGKLTMNEGTDVTASYDSAADTLSYTFTWHDASEETENYELRIYGKTENEESVLLEKVYPVTRTGDATSCSYAVDDAAYDRLELVVIQRDTGYAPADTKTQINKGKVVPRILTQELSIRTRLPKLSQPTVKLIDQNDLDYRISWQDISARVDASERDDLRYAVYIQTDEKTEQLCTTDQTQVECDLESYAGKTVQIYVIAYIDENDLKQSDSLTKKTVSFRSKIGLKRDLTIATRLAQPIFASSPFSWSYRDYAIDLNNTSHVLSESQFTSNALKLNLTFTSNGNYVMNAVLFNTKAEAEKFVSDLSGTPYDQYVALEKILIDTNYKRLSAGDKPVMLSIKNKANCIYVMSPSFSDISYAGGYIVPLVRATASTGISSYWTCGSPYQIPRVRLDTPDLEQLTTDKTYASFGENLRNFSAESGTPFTNVTVRYETYRFTQPSYVKEDRLTLTTRDGETYELTVSGNTITVHTAQDVETTAKKQANADGSYDYTYTLSGAEECILDAITNSVSGTYRVSRTYRAAYRMTFDCGIRRTEEDGVATYELRLPQTRYAISADGCSIRGTSRLITNIWIQAIPGDTSRYEASAEKSS